MKNFKSILALILLLSFMAYDGQAQRRKKNSEPEPVTNPLDGVSLGSFKWRSVGPALTSGRIADIAVNPDNHSEFYVAAAAGGVWKTTNAGTTFTPIFDNYGSYSIGALAMDPNNSNVIWVGTGENNNQRSVSYGDGIYKSIDGGKSFKNLGLKNSEHIGMIAIDPRNSDVVYVASVGPLWSAGGDRGLYKTTDGGENWELVLEISENTGINEVHMDPRNPDVLYATAHQRRRRQWTYLGGGPESGIYKSTDAGATWEKINKGLPSGDKGRIGLDISPANPEVIYAIVEAKGGQGGFYKSTNRGATWEKQSSHSTSGNYYQEIVADPVEVDRVYSLNTFTVVTTDGGKTFNNLGEKSKHWDNHAMWINPNNNKHILQGCDGGVYESFDQGQNWKFFTNLPVTQFYKVSVDNDEPFYNIMGGTQDNYSLLGPSQTVSQHGIVSSDWIVTQGGDGFESVADPSNPNIIYSQSQNGGLVRFDKQSGETVSIQPKPREGESAYNFNWDSPLMVSPHDPKTIYYAANKLFRSRDRGDSWEVISDELDQDIDRNLLPVMGKVWPMDAVAKNGSTSRYGAGVSLDESRLVEGLIYVGSDDGQISITEDNGRSWIQVNEFPGVPANTYVYDLVASKHDENVVYAAFNNHKSGDFTPYIYKSADKGRTWTSISNNLPEGAIYAIEQDHVDPNILFVGTEYGVHVSVNDGQTWTALKSGLPTANVRDMMIQERENDLVVATFGRGFYVLDNYAGLREINEELKQKNAHLFAVKPAYMFNTWTPLGSLGSRDKGFQGEMFHSSPNPTSGAIIKFWVKEGVTTLAAERRKREAEQFKNGEPIPYPTIQEYEAEQNEKASFLVFTITDQTGDVVSELRQAYRKGMNQVVWDMTYMDMNSINARMSSPTQSLNSTGIYVVPGEYEVSMNAVIKGEYQEWGVSTTIELKELDNRTIPAENWAAMAKFKKDAARLVGAMGLLSNYMRDTQTKLNEMRAAAKTLPVKASLDRLKEIEDMQRAYDELNQMINGNSTKNRLDIDGDFSTRQRAQNALYNVFRSLSNVTGTSETQYEIAAKQFTDIMREATTFKAAMDKMISCLQWP
jgi:photosystem II stability/assembly factor-like uncharacterized protein